MSQPSAVSGLRCSYSADERADPLAGSAAHAKGFVLIESPGAWGYDALKESRLDAEIATAVAAQGRRGLLPGDPGQAARRAAPSASRWWFVVDSTPGAEKIYLGTYHSDSELLEISLHIEEHEPSLCRCTSCAPMDGTTRAAPYEVGPCCPPRGRAARPRLGVLAHRRRPIRAERSRAPAWALLRSRRAGAGSEIIAAQERSEVVVDLLRGRTVFRPAVQAAQHFARAEHGGRAIDDFRPIAWEATPAGDVRVDLDHAGDRLAVVVRPPLGPTPGS